MKDFIRADFYRLMRSKGFWITEFLLFCVISSATFLQANIHFGANISRNAAASQSLGKLTGLQALDYFAGNTDSLLLFTIIIISMVLGVDLSRKLYKNCLSYGISKLSYYFSKFFVCVSTIAWISIISLVLYASHSIVSSFLTYFIGGALLSIPLIFYPDNEWLPYLTLRFNTAMAADGGTVIKAILTTSAVTFLFLIGGLKIFKTKNL